MNRVRRRNESAWLLPNDGTRTNHRLRQDMRRFDPDDEVDLVVVGCGAGRRRPHPATGPPGLAGGGLRRRAVLGPRPGLGERRGRSARTLLDRAPGDLGRATRWRSAATTRAAGSAGRWSTSPATRPASIPRTSHTLSTDGVGADWPIDYEALEPYYVEMEEELPVAGQTLALGRSPPLPAVTASRWAATAWPSSEGCAALGIEVRVGPVAIVNGRFGNRPHCIYRGFCLQGCKVNAKASPLITHVPDALAHGAEIRADCMVSRVEIDGRGRASGVTLLPRRGRVPPTGPAGGRGRLLDRDAPAAAQLGLRPRSPTGCATTSTRSAGTSWSRARRRRPVATHEEIRAYKAPPPEASTEAFYETDPTKGYRRGFSLQCISPLPIVFAEHVAAQGHWGETAARVHAGLRPLGHLRRPVRVPSPTPRTGSPWPTRPIGTACRSPTSPTRCATTTGPWSRRPPTVMADMHRAGRGGGDPSPSTATPT